MKWFWDGNSAKINIFEQIGSFPPMVDNFFFEWIALAIRMDNNFLKRISQAVRGDEAWRTLLVSTAKNLTSFGSYDLIKTQIASIFGKKLKFINSFPLNFFFFLAVRPK